MYNYPICLYQVVADVILSHDNHAVQYQVYVRTGMWKGYGTSARVGIVLYGDNGCTGNIYLTDPNLRKKFFARASVNHFTLYLPESLGQLFKIEIWHDDTGRNSAWFLEDVYIVDSQTKEDYHFIAKKWLSLHKGDEELKIEIRAADEKQIKGFRNVTYTRIMKKLVDGHLWLSVCTKPPHSPFTRCQRLSCCLSTLFAALVANAMFYNFGKKPEDTFKVGPLQMSWAQIMIGIQSSLVAVPVNVLLVLIFRNIRESSKSDRYSFVDDNTRRSGFLPYFFLYIAWILCLATSVTAAAFTFFYSITWGKETSDQWLTSIMVSIIEDIVVIQPLKVVLVASLISMIIRKPPKVDNVVGSSLWKNMTTETGTSNVLADEVVFKERGYKKKMLQMYRKMGEIAIFLVFVVFLMIVCYGNRKSTRYLVTRSMEETFSEFEEVSTCMEVKGRKERREEGRN